jgi:hypothetical protein
MEEAEHLPFMQENPGLILGTARRKRGRTWVGSTWFTPVILQVFTISYKLEAEIGGIEIQSQPGQIVCETPISQTKIHILVK